MDTHNYSVQKRKVDSHRDGHIPPKTAQSVPPFHFTVIDNQLWRVTVRGSLSIGRACHAAGKVCVYVSIYLYLRRLALAVLQNCREALVTLLF